MNATPSIQQLRRAVEIAEQIERLEQELRTVLGQEAPAAEGTSTNGRSNAPTKRLKAGKKRTMPPGTREKMAAAQRARWAKGKGKK